MNYAEEIKEFIKDNKLPDKELQTQAFFNEVFKVSPTLLSAIPDDFITQEMCNKAVSYSTDLFLNVPSKFKTKEMYNEVNNKKCFVKR